MPTSYHYQLSQIVELIILTDPSSLLDIGTGFGKYGVLAREYLELWGSRTKEYGKWERRIDGIEAFEGYITPLHRFVYDNIYIGEAFEIVSQLQQRYDLVLLIDVIEHFEKTKGIEFVKKILKIGKNIIISTPKGEFPQDKIFNNPFEIHKSTWKKKDFKRFGEHFFIKNERSIICYIGEDAARIRKSLRITTIKKILKKYFPISVYLYRVYKFLKESSVKVISTL
ncbi:MAG: hypothetical protein QXI58_08120 [Candidatus Micrarchaeia archaeon]